MGLKNIEQMFTGHEQTTRTSMADASQPHRKPSTEHTVRRLELVVLRMYPRRMIVSTSYTGTCGRCLRARRTGLVGLVVLG